MHEPRKPNERIFRCPAGIALGIGVAFGIALHGGRPGRGGG